MRTPGRPRQRGSSAPTGPRRPDFINIRVEELTGDRPFERLDDFITQEELRALSDRYKRIAGYSIEDLATPPTRSAT